MAMHKGSLNHWLSTFDVGEVRYKELNKAAAIRAMQSISSRGASRRPRYMRDWRFRSARFLGVPIACPDATTGLLRVERIK